MTCLATTCDRRRLDSWDFLAALGPRRLERLPRRFAPPLVGNCNGLGDVIIMAMHGRAGAANVRRRRTRPRSADTVEHALCGPKFCLLKFSCVRCHNKLVYRARTTFLSVWSVIMQLMWICVLCFRIPTQVGGAGEICQDTFFFIGLSNQARKFFIACELK